MPFTLISHFLVFMDHFYRVQKCIKGFLDRFVTSRTGFRLFERRSAAIYVKGVFARPDNKFIILHGLPVAYAARVVRRIGFMRVDFLYLVSVKINNVI